MAHWPRTRTSASGSGLTRRVARSCLAAVSASNLHDLETMWQVLGSMVDVLHALLMAAWVVGLPLLFVRRWPRVTRAYGVYAVSFIVLSQLSQLALGQCFLTTIATRLWKHASASGPAQADEWFTVRLASWVFHLTPSHRAVVLVSEVLILLTALGTLVSLRSLRPHARLTERHH